MVEHVLHEDLNLGIIIRSGYSKEGIDFFTDDQSSLQIGYMNREQDYVIRPHVHNEVKREILLTQEVLFIKSGKVRIDFYNQAQHYLKSTIVETGDTILLAEGGHGFKMLEPSEILEVKQGPYAGEMDKLRFDPVADELVKIESK